MNATNQNQNQIMTDYKNYSLENLENWLHDAISCGEASPEEIYSTIKNAVQDEYDAYKKVVDRCYTLLELLNGHRPMVNFNWFEDMEPSFNTSFSDNLIGSDVIHFDPAGNDVSDLVNSDLPNGKKWTVPVEVDAASGEYYFNLPDDMMSDLKWKEGDTLEYFDNQNGSFTIKKV